MFHPIIVHIFSDMSSLEQFENVLNKLRAFKKQPLIWITGDFNAPYINWESQSLFEGSPYPSTHESSSTF